MRPALRLALVAIGSCAYAGLAVLGWGGFRSFFSHPAFVALVVVLLALSVVASFAGGNVSAGVREARGNRWVIPVFVIIGFLNAYLPAYIRIARSCGRLMVTRFAGSVSRSSPLAVH
jgi:hypothetical protein